jgi:hypothetical protein
MRKHLCAPMLLVLSAVLLSAECRAGYQPGTVLKVFDQDLSSAARPSKALEEGQLPEPHSATEARILIFVSTGEVSTGGTSGGEVSADKVRSGKVHSGKRYELRMPLGAKAEASVPGVGQEVCFQNDGREIHVLTDQGKALPGIAQPIPTLPHR